MAAPPRIQRFGAPSGETSVEKRTLAFNWTMDQGGFYTQFDEIQKKAGA
jgi:hypothetical protein